MPMWSFPGDKSTRVRRHPSTSRRGKRFVIREHRRRTRQHEARLERLGKLRFQRDAALIHNEQRAARDAERKRRVELKAARQEIRNEKLALKIANRKSKVEAKNARLQQRLAKQNAKMAKAQARAERIANRGPGHLSRLFSPSAARASAKVREAETAAGERIASGGSKAYHGVFHPIVSLRGRRRKAVAETGVPPVGAYAESRSVDVHPEPPSEPLWAE